MAVTGPVVCLEPAADDVSPVGDGSRRYTGDVQPRDYPAYARGRPRRTTGGGARVSGHGPDVVVGGTLCSPARSRSPCHLVQRRPRLRFCDGGGAVPAAARVRARPRRPGDVTRVPV